MPHSLIFDHMFQMPLPILEKLARPVIVYLVLVVLLRIFGKRELAQLNPFDLVVLLSLSNTVQNAIIGDDNSVSGGVIGAVGLLAINWLVVRVLFRSPALTRIFEGRATVLVRNGQIDIKALERESLTREELIESFTARALKESTRCASASSNRMAPSMWNPLNRPMPTSAITNYWPGWMRSPRRSHRSGNSRMGIKIASVS